MTLRRGPGPAAGAGDEGPAPAEVVVHVADLVLVRRTGQDLAELAPPLARELAARGVPAARADEAAAAILEGAGRRHRTGPAVGR